MTSNRLPILADAIRNAESSIRRSAAETAASIINAGQSLIEAKELLPHGAWGRWLKEHCGVSERSAQRYMTVARSGLKSDTVSDLGLRGALASLTRPPKRAKFQIWADHTDDEYEAMKESISDIGVLVPVEYDQDGEIIDGHCRVRICKDLGIKDWPRVTRVYVDDEARLSASRSFNGYRKHLNEGELAASVRQGHILNAVEKADPGFVCRTLDTFIANHAEPNREAFWTALTERHALLEART